MGKEQKIIEPSQQCINYLKIKKLKGIHDLEIIRFDEKHLTAILGPNGCGKSTILHALACCYKPQPSTKEALKEIQFSKYFTPTTDATWTGSEFTLVHSYRFGDKVHNEVETKFEKSSDRWTPRADNRPERNVQYIGIKSCVPKIEEEKHKSIIKFNTTEHSNNTLIQQLGAIFNREYEKLLLHKTSKDKKYIGLRLNGVNYSALAMGAGEQRVIEILSAVFKAPKYGLIIIDEIDLLLHTSALNKLISIINQRAIRQSLQIIFTTHREAIIELNDIVSIKHLHTVKINQQTDNELEDAATYKSLCISNTTPDAIRRLTGNQPRTLEIFVEDTTAEAIVKYELSKLGIRKDASITIYGASKNCFVISAGLVLHEKHDPEKQLFLLDGDVNATEEEIIKNTESVLTGTEVYAEARRKKCISGIKKLNPTEGANKSPEAQIHRMICELPFGSDEEENDLIRTANEIGAQEDDHLYFTKIFEIFGYEKAEGCEKLVKAASKSPHWDNYIFDLREWLITRKQKYLDHSHT